VSALRVGTEKRERRTAVYDRVVRRSEYSGQGTSHSRGGERDLIDRRSGSRREEERRAEQ